MNQRTTDSEVSAARDEQATTRFVLHVVAHFFGEEIDEVFLSAGTSAQLGRTGTMALPVPAGQSSVADVRWLGPRRVEIRDGSGERHELVPGGRSLVNCGPVSLHFTLVARYHLRRTEDVKWAMSLAWFTAVFAATLLAQQGALLWDLRCMVAPQLFPACYATVTDSNSGTGRYTAEYIARLLKEDYSGDDEGVVDAIDREDDEKRSEHIYIPAGGEGSFDEMGGSSEVGPEEIRGPDPEEESAKDAGGFELVVDEQIGTPVELPDLQGTGHGIEQEAIAEVEAEEITVPTEDKEGWGLHDWYDEVDEEIDELEIEYMLLHAKERLRIDPEDISALSTLSYYQYLAEDYPAAEVTYDKLLEIEPGGAAWYNNKALIFKRRGDYEHEESLYRVALALEPDDVTALNNLAVCLAHQGQITEAVAIMDRLAILDPDEPYADLHRAKVWAAAGQEERAYEYLDKSLRGMAALDTLHHIEFRQDLRLDPAFEKMRQSSRFHALLVTYYGVDTPLQE